MTKIFTMFFCLLAISANCQPSDNSKLGKIKNISSYTIKENKIQTISNWTIYCDTLCNPRDSFLITQSFYDRNGVLTEVHQDFKNKEYGWIKYFYNKEGFVIKIDQKDIWLDGVYVKESPYYLCDKFENGQLVETSKYYTDMPNNEVEQRIYEYILGIQYKTKFYRKKKLYAIDLMTFTFY